jgi:hypothetical protein
MDIIGDYHFLSLSLTLSLHCVSLSLPPSLPPQINLCHGIPEDMVVESCTAGAGTLTIEFTLLSRLLGDPVYENVARRSVRAIWERRHRNTGLVGQYINWRIVYK